MNYREKFLNNCIVLDTETTNKQYKKAEIIEVAYTIKIDNQWNFNSTLFKPLERIKPEICAITHITNKMVQDKETFKESDRLELYNDLIEAVRETHGSMIAYNSFYDKNVLQRNGVKTVDEDWLCMWRFAKFLFGNDPTVEAYNLSYIFYRFLEDKVPENFTPHRAESDVHVTALLLEYFLDVAEARNLINKDAPYKPQLHALLHKPIITEIMPIGKYKGKKMIDIPLDYYTWLLNNHEWLNEESDLYDSDFAESVTYAIETIMDKK